MNKARYVAWISAPSRKKARVRSWAPDPARRDGPVTVIRPPDGTHPKSPMGPAPE